MGVLEHEGYALDKARAWWMQRARMRPIPATVTEAANIAHTLPKPSRMKIEQDGKYWRVLDYDFKPVERQPAFIEEERSYAF